MLNFDNCSDEIFQKILNRSLETMLEDLSGENKGANELFEANYPLCVRSFSRLAAINVARDLIKFSNDSNLWRLTDYHYVLIYDALRVFTDYYNDDEIEKLIVEGEEVLAINFEDMIDTFFFDTDFLSDPNHVGFQEVKKHMGFSDELFGLVSGMKAHQDELKIQLYEKGNFIPKKSEYFQKGSQVFPDYDAN